MGLLRFVVASCSSEDEEHPARELHNTTQQSRGWQSAHFAPFPQELLLRFEGLVHISELQLLCHQYKIPSRVELSTSTDPSTLASASSASFHRLGHFSLDPNSRSRYRSRELKTVYVQASATMLRISLHKCHLNELNVYAQVGVLAIRVHGTGAGEYLPRGPPQAAHPHPQQLGSQPHLHDGRGDAYPPAPVTARPFQLARAPRPVDASTQRQLAALDEAKARAIGREDYDEAKRLKGLIEEVRTAGEAICALELQKRAAVQREDYDEAKQLKEQVDSLRANVALVTGLVDGAGGGLRGDNSGGGSGGELSQWEQHHGGSGSSGKHGSAQERSLPGAHGGPRAHSRGGSESGGYAFGEESADPDPVPADDLRRGGIHGAQDSDRANADAVGIGSPSADAAAGQSNGFGAHASGSLHGNPPGSAAESADGGEPTAWGARVAPARAATQGATGKAAPELTSQRAYDERALPQPADSYEQLGAGAEEAPARTAGGLGGSGGDGGDGGVAGAEGQGDMPEPEPLSKADEAEAALMLEVLGRHTVQCAYSKAWALRQAALRALQAALPSLTGQHAPIQVLRATVQLLRRCANDKIAQVFLASLELADELQQLSGTVRPAEASSLLEPLVAAWLGKTAETSARVREGTEAALLVLCRASAHAAEAIGAQASAPLRKAGDVRGLLGRLSFLAALLAELGGSAQLVERSVAFAKAALSSPNGQVRQRAVDVCREAYRLAEPGSLGWLLDGLKPALRETVASMLNEVDAERSLHGDEEGGEGEGGAYGGDAAGRRGAELPAETLSDIAEGNEEDGSMRAASTFGSRLLPPGGGASVSGAASAHDGGNGGGLLASTSELKRSFAVPPHGDQSAASGQAVEAGGGGGADEQTCQFCARHDPSFNDENLDLHFWRDCPMLMTCSLCDQVVEISYFREHLLTECESDEGPQSGERIPEGTCPLCAAAVSPDDDGWSDHLLVATCPKNPRPVLTAGNGALRR